MNAKRLRRNWRRTLTAHLNRAAELLRRRGPLNAEAVHDLRVALRRSRLLLQLRSKQRDRQRTKRFRAAARSIMDAFAPPRDIDVAIEWARAAHASPALLSKLLQERTRACRRAERRLKRLKPNARPSRLKAVEKVDAPKLARRFERWRQAIEARCHENAGRAAQLTTPELHALRRDIRRWRYLRELLATRREVARDTAVHALIAAQEALGAIQDVEVILNCVRRCGRTREVTQLKHQLQADLEHCRAAALQELARFGPKPARRA